MKRSKFWLSLLMIPMCLLIWSCGDDKETTEVSNSSNYYFQEESDSTPDYDPETAAILQSFATVREAANGLPEHTVYRPADLSKFEEGSIPVIVWANGACRPSNYGFVFISTMVSSHGFIVIANGAYDYPAISGGSVDPQKQIDAMDWLESAEGLMQLKGRADINKIAVAGQSCGGNEALLAGADERTKTILAWNTGFFPDDSGVSLAGERADLLDLHSPTIFINGGETDVAYNNSNANYEIAAGNDADYPFDGIPVYYAEHTHAGHSGLLYGIYDGSGNTTLLTEAERLYVNWLDFTLNGNEEAEAYFFDNGVSQIDQWEGWFPLWSPDVDNENADLWKTRYQNWE